METKKYYPISLDIAGKSCVVVGGGEVAQRKVERLLAHGAHVTVVSRELTGPLEETKNHRAIKHIDAAYETTHIQGAFMVIGATDREDVNDRISKDAMSLGILVNIVDDPDKCNFILPALVQQGDLSIAISTGGKSPALARMIKEELEPRFGPEYETLLTVMGSLRKKILARGHNHEVNREIFAALLDSALLTAIRDGNKIMARKIIYDLTGIDMDIDP